jgi:hypothetical protein
VHTVELKRSGGSSGPGLVRGAGGEWIASNIIESNGRRSFGSAFTP